MSSTNTTLQDLCQALDEELERQEVLGGLIEAQRAAIHAHDHKTLEARTEAIQLIAREARQAESGRMELFERLADAHALPAGKRNLSGLMAFCPPADQRRLGELQVTLRERVKHNQQAMRDNARAISHSLRAVRVSLSSVQPMAEPPAYAGPRRGSGKPAPVLLDQRG